MSVQNDEEKDALLKSVNGESYDSCEQINQVSFIGIAESNKRRRNTLRVIYFTMFIGSISFSIVMSSLWPFLKTLDATVSETFMGYINAGYSLAQMLASVTMGYWSDKRKAIEPMLLSIVFLTLGSGLYAYAEAFGSTGIWVVFAARVLLGLSAGSTAVARSCGAHLSSVEDRATVMSNLSLWQAIGFFIGPALQAGANVFGSDGLYVKSIKLYLNIYTIPCYIMILLSVVNFVLLIFYFSENVDESNMKFKEEIGKLHGASTSFEPLSMVPIVVCLIFWFVAMTIFALNETIMSPILMNEFAWSRQKTAFYGGIILAAAGVIAIACFLAVSTLIKKFGCRLVIFFGYIIMLLGFIIYLPWGPGHPKLTEANILLPNGTSTIVSPGGGGGCPYTYSWCHTTPAIPFMQWLTAAVLVGIGYPIAVITLSVIYSQIVGPFPQGKYMGWLTAIGSFARVIGPLYVTLMYENYGLRWTATGINCMLLVTLILLSYFWKWLVPYGKRHVLVKSVV